MSCCPTIYWCVNGVPTAGDYDEETGIISPPTGATGGPYTTIEEARESCFPGDVVVTGVCEVEPECSTPFRLPGDGFTISFLNQTTGLNFPNSLFLPLNGTPVYIGCAEGAFAGYGASYAAFAETSLSFFGVHLQFCWSCTGSPGAELTAKLSVLYGYGPLGYAIAPAPSGWTLVGTGPTYLANVTECGDQFPESVFVGRVTFSSGEADVYLDWH